MFVTLIKKLILCLVAAVAVAVTAVERYDLAVGGDRKLFYYAEHRLPSYSPEIEYAVIMIHGSHGGGYDYANKLRKRLATCPDGKKVLCIAPSFYTKKTCKEPDIATALRWKGNWRGGGYAINGSKISSFEVIDRINALLANREFYPNLKHILICGFSAGGQFVNRYLAVARLPESPQLQFSFVVGAPSIYLYIDARRMINGVFEIPKSAPSNYNFWYFGLENRYAYAQEVSEETIRQNLSQRYALYLCGTEDVGEKDLNTTPAAGMQGKNRLERFRIYKEYVAQFPEWEAQVKFREIPGQGHAKQIFFLSPDFMSLVFGKRIFEEPACAIAGQNFKTTCGASKESIVAVAPGAKYNTCVLSSSARYMFFNPGWASSIACFASIRSSFTRVPESRSHCFFCGIKAQISTLPLRPICRETFFFLPVWM